MERAPQVIGEGAFARFVGLVGDVDKETERLVPPPCWYLAGIGVDPAHQQQGIGGALVRAFFSLAAADGIPVCLAVLNPDNLRFYRNLGMALAGEGVAPHSSMPFWVFRWE